MKLRIVQPLLVSAALGLAGAAFADDLSAGGIAVRVAPDGSVEMNNFSATSRSGAPAASAQVVAPASAASSRPAEKAAGQQAADEPPKDPREQYRDAMMQGAEGTTGANPAVSRRYKMMDRETYNATVRDASAPTPKP